jgi:hypothetical protein
MDNKKESNQASFKSKFLTWDEFRQANFITQLFLSKDPDLDTVSQLLDCLDSCSETIAFLLIKTLFADFYTYRQQLLPYIQNAQNPETMRLLMIMHMTTPNHLDEETITAIVSLYLDPHDTAMEPVVEAFVSQYPELALPSLISYGLKPHTAIRSQLLLQIIGQSKIKAILGDINQFPTPVIDCIKQIPLNPRPPKTPGI